MTHHIKCYTNSLTTHHRLHSIHIRSTSSSPNATSTRPFPCYLCDDPSGKDHLQHLYRDCRAIGGALSLLKEANILKEPLHTAIRDNIHQGNPTYHFNFPADKTNPSLHLRFSLCLNLAIWKARNRVKTVGGKYQKGEPEALIAKITNSLLLSSANPTTSKIRKGHNLASFLSLLNSPLTLPTDAFIFTSGGASPDPGPGGAGALIIHTVRNKANLLANPHSRLFAPLGHGTAKLGGITALGICGRFLTIEPINPPPTAYHVFVDSTFALRAATSLCKDNRYTDIAYSAKTLIRSSHTPTHFYHIAKRSNNPGGNVAATLTAHAIQASTSDPNYSPPPSDPFLYHKLPP